MRYFTGDFHFCDDRLHLYGRELVATNSDEIDNIIIENWNNIIKDNDEIYILGDVAYTEEGLKYISQLNGKKILIKGNYDQQFTQNELLEYFDDVCDNIIIHIDDEEIYLNHYPTNAKTNMFNLVSHIHGTWKVQRNMINVGVDAWHFQPVSEDMIRFQINGIRKHYDKNVFAGELPSNNVKSDVDKHKYQLNWIKDDDDVSWLYKWKTENDETLIIREYEGVFIGTLSYKPYTIKGTKSEMEEKFKVKIGG